MMSTIGIQQSMSKRNLFLENSYDETVKAKLENSFNLSISFIAHFAFALVFNLG